MREREHGLGAKQASAMAIQRRPTVSPVGAHRRPLAFFWKETKAPRTRDLLLHQWLPGAASLCALSRLPPDATADGCPFVPWLTERRCRDE